MANYSSFLFTGHGNYSGGYDPGACGNNYQEHQVAARINEAAKRYLSHLNIHYGVNNYKNVLTAGNSYSSGHGISTHLNSSVPAATGVEIWVPLSQSDISAEQDLVSGIASLLGITNRGVKSKLDNDTDAGVQYNRVNGSPIYGHDYYGEINRGRSHGTNVCILEVGFISNAGDISKINANIEGIGRLLAQYIARRCGSSINGGSPSPSSSETIYRVRKSADDAQSQIGAYKNLNSAKELADKNQGYKVFDGSRQVYPQTASSSSGYLVKVDTDVLNVRTGPGTNHTCVQTVRQDEVYTITETSGNWGKLKSGAGWICLDYTVRV